MQPKIPIPQLSPMKDRGVSLTEKADMRAAEYWDECNKKTIAGYELPVPYQNMLDSTYEVFVDEVDKLIDDMLNQVPMSDLIDQAVRKVPLNLLTPFLAISSGVSHHYHRLGGFGPNEHKLSLDLKILPTFHDSLGDVMNALVFIAFDMELTNTNVQPNKWLIVMTTAIGDPEHLPKHAPFYSTDGVTRSASHMGSSALGHFMRYTHNATFERSKQTLLK